LLTRLRGSQITREQVEAVFGKAGMIKIRKKTKEPNVWVGNNGAEVRSLLPTFQFV
jgi:hypothetical protein